VLRIDCLWGVVASVLWMCTKDVTTISSISLCTCFVGYRGSAMMQFSGSEMEMGREERGRDRSVYFT